MAQALEHHMSAETPAAPKKKGKTLILILAVGLLMGGGGAGAAWYLTKHNAADGGEEAHAEVKKKKKKPSEKPLFTNLDPFTVNLQDARGDRFAQIGVTLQIEDADTENQLKERMPSVRNNVLLLISSKRVEDLLTPEGKLKLAQQIRVRAAQAIGLDVEDESADEAEATDATRKGGKRRKAEVDNPVRDVLFSQFIVQ